MLTAMFARSLPGALLQLSGLFWPEGGAARSTLLKAKKPQLI